jgi:hypothetical protein
MRQPDSFITLNEAVTWLAFGEMRTPSEECDSRCADQKKLRELIDQSVHQAQTSEKYQDFPTCLPYNPRSALIDRLELCRSSWPPLAKTLYSLAKRQEAEQRHYDEQYETALSIILDAAADERIELVGQVSAMPGAQVCVIPSTDVLGQATIDYKRAHLGPDTTADRRGRPYAILKCGPSLARNYYNVQVSRRRFREKFKSSLRPLSSQSRRETHERIRAWYLSRYENWPADFPPPSRDEDVSDARNEFPGTQNLRSLVRSLRNEIASKWTAKGRRSQAAK